MTDDFIFSQMSKSATSQRLINTKHKQEISIMTYSVTAVYALPLAVIFLVHFFRIAGMRQALGVAMGDGGNTQLQTRIRCHGNFIEWVPMVLIAMMLAEGNGAPAMYLHASGALLVLGRLIHPFGMKADQASNPLRFAGNTMNILALVNAAVCIIMTTFFA
jgi:uncharacterized membrane protein YecN with MAPEG domain